MPLLSSQSPEVRTLLLRHWGYDTFLPNQSDAIDGLLAGRDVLAILPTGGGKSICYQLPALALPGTALVVSPLVALMKDQVDSLTGNGIPAAALNSALSSEERRDITTRLRNGTLKLLYVSPERLAMPDMRELLSTVRLSFLAVDEAHCVSQWGHEFRPEYRQVGLVREWFPELPVLACTATATEAVRDDIREALALRRPVEVVGSFDRPNLVYRAIYRRDVVKQLEEVLARHKDEAGVVYCIRRADVEELTEKLVKRGHKAVPYHAGLSPETRRKNQDAFSEERIDLVVATVAFGMGIDRSNVRFVVHTGMPKSLENYQQEAGRAGRDRLEAECVLFYDASDPMTWRRIQGPPQTAYDQEALRKIEETYRFCRTLTCRHRLLVGYFGQPFEKDNCGACDVCLGEHQVLPDSTTVARKILSCVARVKERFGARHVAEVLKGSKNEKITQHGHEALSVHGLLREHAVADIADWVDQLVGHGFLLREGEWGTIRLTASGTALMKGQGEVQLSMPRPTKGRGQAKTSTGAVLGSEAQGLFELLRSMRRDIAREKGVPPYLVFSDATLREIAQHRPQRSGDLLRIKGIGEAKARDYGERVLEVVQRAG